jgi:hypothetical protein
MNKVIDQLLNSEEAAIRYKVWVNVLGHDPDSAETRQLRQEIKQSPRVQKLLSEREEMGNAPPGPYRKWTGAHWMLAGLADIGYPPGDKALLPLREQIYDWLFGEEHQKKIKSVNGRVRRCASQEGNALYYLLAFLARQRAVIERCCQGERPDSLLPEEQMAVDLIHSDGCANSGLRTYLQEMMAVMAFDAERRGG